MTYHLTDYSISFCAPHPLRYVLVVHTLLFPFIIIIHRRGSWNWIDIGNTATTTSSSTIVHDDDDDGDKDDGVFDDQYGAPDDDKFASKS